jgi:hypothetical protein
LKHNSKILEDLAKEMFDQLREHLNEKVIMKYFDYGRLRTKTGKLTEVNDFNYVVIDCLGAPFIGYGCAIRSIQSEDKELLYLNPYLGIEYDKRTNEEVDEARKTIFGERIADKEKRKREEHDRKYQEYLERTAREAKRDKLMLQKEGLALIKPETAKDWMTFTENNCNDGYSCSVVRATLGIMKKMEAGVPFEEAEQQVFNEEFDLTGFQAGAAASFIAHFAKQGEEFRKYWNSKFGVEAEEEKGTVNPAIITVGK